MGAEIEYNVVEIGQQLRRFGTREELVEAVMKGPVLATLPIGNEGWIQQPGFFPVNSEEVAALRAATLGLLSSDDGTMVNGLRDAIWAVYVIDEGVVEISNGFHRYELMVQLAEEFPDTIKPEIYCRIVCGTRVDLLRERLAGITGHDVVAPARVALFLKESWPFAVPYHAVLSHIEIDSVNDEASIAQLIADLGITRQEVVDELQSAYELARLAIQVTNLNPYEVASFALIAERLPESLIHRIRKHGDIKIGEIPLEVAFALARSESLMGDYARQESLVEEFASRRLSSKGMVKEIADLDSIKSRARKRGGRQQLTTQDISSEVKQPSSLPRSHDAVTNVIFGLAARLARTEFTAVTDAAELSLLRFALARTDFDELGRMEFIGMLMPAVKQVNELLARFSDTTTAVDAELFIADLCEEAFEIFHDDRQAAKALVTRKVSRGLSRARVTKKSHVPGLKEAELPRLREILMGAILNISGTQVVSKNGSNGSGDQSKIEQRIAPRRRRIGNR